jgi:L-asparaginase II
MNCSAKHAAMLVTAASTTGRWTATGSDHPLQLALRGTVAELAGSRWRRPGWTVRAPLFALSLTGLAERSQRSASPLRVRQSIG